jgi:hypothetical protein
MARKINPRFTAIEVEVLTNECSRNFELLKNGDNSAQIKANKDQAWLKITEKVNAVNSSSKKRTSSECKRSSFTSKSSQEMILQVVPTVRKFACGFASGKHVYVTPKFATSCKILICVRLCKRLQ